MELRRQSFNPARRIRPLVILGLAVALAALCACASGQTSANSSGGAGSSASGPVKIGIVENKSGVLAGLAQAALRGYQLAADQAPKLLGGRKVELVQVQDDGTPAGTVAAVTQLIERDGVQLLIGQNTDDQGLALAPIVARSGAVWLDNTSEGAALTGASCSAGYFRISQSVTSTAKVFDQVIAASGIKNWAYVGSDFGFGHDFASLVGAYVKSIGGSVSTSVFIPLGTADMGSYISQLAANKSTGLIEVLAGSDAVTFVKQAVQFNLFAKYQRIVDNGFENMSAAELQTYGPMLTNDVSPAPYDVYSTVPGIVSYNKLFKAAYPSLTANGASLSVTGYEAMSVMIQAVAKAGTADGMKVRQALAGGSFTLPWGTFAIRASDHQMYTGSVLTTPAKVNGTWIFAAGKTYSAAQVTPPNNGCHLP
jgi:branched-chain amino acid transport system substrate-binding protein